MISVTRAAGDVALPNHFGHFSSTSAQEGFDAACPQRYDCRVGRACARQTVIGVE